MQAFLCEEKSLATNLMRGKLIKRANFCEHYKKCVHLFANKNYLRVKNKYVLFLHNCRKLSLFSYFNDEISALFLWANKNFRALDSDHFKKIWQFLRAFWEFLTPKKCDQKKSLLQQATKLTLLDYSCGGDLYLKSVEPSVQEFRA